MFAVVDRGTARTPLEFSLGFGSSCTTDRHLRDHLAHMVRDFETSTQGQIPATDFADFVARRDKRGPGAVPEKEDTSKAVIVVPTAPYKVGHHQRTTKTQHDPKDPSNACALLAACVTFPAVSFAVDGTIAVAMHGHVSNAREIRELYGLPALADGNGSGSPLPGIEPGTPSSKDASATNSATNTRAGKVRRALDDSVKMPPPPPVRSPDLEGAALLLALYKKRFEDKDGDHSDQPATALVSCEGSFSFVLLDTATNAVLASRSKHSDTHALFWGTAPRNPGESSETLDCNADPANKVREVDDAWDGSTLFALDPGSLNGPCGGAAAAFPLGAYYYVDETMRFGVIQRLTAGRLKREVKPVHRINSSGKVCGLGFYTQSGNDLASLAGKFVA